MRDKTCGTGSAKGRPVIKRVETYCGACKSRMSRFDMVCKTCGVEVA